MHTPIFTLLTILMSTITLAQNSPSQVDLIDFKTAQVDLFINQHSNLISGTVTYNFNVIQDTKQVFVDAKNLTRYDVKLDDMPIKASFSNDQLVIFSRFRESETHKLTIEFATDPDKALYHIDRDNDGQWDQLWTQGQGKYTSNWLPSIDDVNDKMIWDIQVTAPSQHTVIANGVLTDTITIDQNKKWIFDMDNPMSSYLVAVAVGDYHHKIKHTASNKPIELYYYPEDSLKVDYTYRSTIQLFDYLESELGVDYPWTVYKQVPVKDFLYSGMENTTTTLFNDMFMVDSIAVNDHSYTNVNAHELAHQWFGNLVTAQSSEHHWLQEGFATYYALLAERDIYGEDHYYMNLFEYAESLVKQNKTGKSSAVINSQASSLTYYQHGAWALHALRKIVGDQAFKQGVKTYLTTYAGQSATTDDFIDIMSLTSQIDLTAFQQEWLTNTQFPAATALGLLRESDFIEQYLQLSARRISSFDESLNSYKETLQHPINEYMAQEMVHQLAQRTVNDQVVNLYQQAAATGNVKIRQAIALSLPEYRPELNSILTSLLDDPSYMTRESALYLLWQGNADRRHQILEQVKDKWQTMNPSLEMAWIVLALNSADYKNNEKYKFMQQLSSYTSAVHSTQTRLAAYDYLINLDAMSVQNYNDLMDGCWHHNWRFASESRSLLQALFKKDAHRLMINKVITTMSNDRQEQIKKLLE